MPSNKRISRQIAAATATADAPRPLVLLSSHKVSGAVDTIPAATDTFWQFTRLPVELRFAIYNLSYVAISVSFCPDSGHRPAISVVNKEAQAEYLRKYTRLKKRASDGRPRMALFVNWEIDVVNLSHSRAGDNGEWMDLRWHLAQVLEFRKWWSKAQRLAIELMPSALCERGFLIGRRSSFETAIWDDEVWESLHKVSPDVKEMIFIITEKIIYELEDTVEVKNFAGDMGVAEDNLRGAFAAAQKNGLFAAAKLVFIGFADEWIIDQGKLVHLITI
ncbi:unnamed protein product [Diplocarpon coronariae]|uniref:2EXR domain-containing protein n=1 Tax=Diplocarpon coronariae TaxID=2795749 RepID=A0A218Z104_9HELO|nr:hypothetical protein B2J93_2794 [Marssonina coronariae]